MENSGILLNIKLFKLVDF